MLAGLPIVPVRVWAAGTFRRSEGLVGLELQSLVVGVAGLATPLSPSGSESFNMFLPPGTFAGMLADQARGRASDDTNIDREAMPVSIVAVANRATGSGDRGTGHLARMPSLAQRAKQRQ